MGRNNSGRSRQAGLTLLELVVTVVIVGILAAIAMPAYSNYSRKAKIHEAFVYLLALNAKQQLYWNDAHDYGPSACAVTAKPGATKYFNYLCDINNSNQGYVLTADGQGDLAGYKFTLTVDTTGTHRATTDFPPLHGLALKCWIDTPQSSC